MLDFNNPAEVAIADKMRAFVLKNPLKGHTYTYAIRNPETQELEVVENSHRPCFGELRRYKGSLRCHDGFGSSENCTRPDDRWPGDLPRPMKEGLREALGMPIYTMLSQDPEKHNKMYSFLLSSRSPWRKGFDFDNFEFIKDKEGTIKGFLMWGTDVDATTMVNLFQHLRSGNMADRWIAAMDKYGLSEIEALLLIYVSNITKSFGSKTDGDFLTINITNTYTFTPLLDVKKFVQGEPRDLSSGITWRNGDDYNRPEIQDLFRDEDSKVMYTTKLREGLGLPTENPYGHLPMETEEALVQLLKKEVSSVTNEVSA